MINMVVGRETTNFARFILCPYVPSEALHSNSGTAGEPWALAKSGRIGTGK
ncbi:hypothetical protein FACS1894172_01340 [Spirochaetia bacterium]|nr:hypothetical protein FACS1894172_01340 [Spirochaetia bacterium]